VRRIVALPIAALALAGCTVPSFGAHKGATTESSSVYHLWQGFSIGGVIIGGFVTVLFLYTIVRYRRKGNEHKHIPRQAQYHLPAEVLYTVMPILVVLGLFAATLVVENKEVANPKTNVTVDVNAFQWGWKFTYPHTETVVIGQTTQDPTMVIPVNTNIHINLTSTDVIHGFYVKAFNFSRYALPGVLNQFTLEAVKTGNFYGQCTQLCGLYHSLMFFNVKVVSKSQYTAWLASTANPAAYAAAQKTTSQQTATQVPTKPASSHGDN
jgi:cytochrome c oxidase subunit II